MIITGTTMPTIIAITGILMGRGMFTRPPASGLIAADPGGMAGYQHGIERSKFAVGADRPAEGDSKWGAYQNFHGVSGHTYFSAVPFITAAKMSENPYQKAIFYGLSTLTGISRINDDKHYFSQSALGWYLAYLSCAVVEKGNDQREGRVHVQLAPVPKGIAVTVLKRY